MMSPFFVSAMLYIAMVTSPYPDLIEMNGGSVTIDGKTITAGLHDVIAPPLSHSHHLCYYGHDKPLCRDVDEFDTLIVGFWNRQAIDIWHPYLRDKLRLPRPHQQMAISHLLNGGAIRVGDKQVIHGSLLSAKRPETYLFAKQLEHDMDVYKKCIFEKDPSCVGY